MNKEITMETTSVEPLRKIPEMMVPFFESGNFHSCFFQTLKANYWQLLIILQLNYTFILKKICTGQFRINRISQLVCQLNPSASTKLCWVLTCQLLTEVFDSIKIFCGNSSFFLKLSKGLKKRCF